MRPPPKPVKKHLAGSFLSSPDPVQRGMSEHPSAIAARARRAEKAKRLEEIKQELRTPLAERKAREKAMKPTNKLWQKAREERADRIIAEVNRPSSRDDAMNHQWTVSADEETLERISHHVEE